MLTCTLSSGTAALLVLLTLLFVEPVRDGTLLEEVVAVLLLAALVGLEARNVEDILMVDLLLQLKIFVCNDKISELNLFEECIVLFVH